MIKPRILQFMDTMTTDSKRCLSKLKPLSETKFSDWLRAVGSIHDGVFCTINEPKKGACTGDSGAGLIAKQTNKLIGIVSWSIGCARGYPDVYTNVYSYIPWIQHHINKTEKSSIFGFFKKIFPENR